MSILKRLQEAKATAKLNVIEQDWKRCLAYLEAQPLDQWVTPYFEVQAKAKKLGLESRKSPVSQNWLITIPDRS